MAVDYDQLAKDIVDQVGGTGNIRSAKHCATRLRLQLGDEGKANTDAIKAMPGIITVVQAGGQYQVVIGDDVPYVHAGVQRLVGGGEEESAGEETEGNLLNRFIALVSSIFQPILWPLAGAGLFKAFLTLFTTFNWLSTESTEYVVLNAAADSLINFLPMVLAIPAAKRFKANQFTAMAIAGALVYPNIIALNDGTAHSFFGIPLIMMSYVSSVLPIIVGVWLQGYLERFLARHLPKAIRNFSVPLLAMLIMVPLILLTVGPLTTVVANGIADGVTWLFAVAPWAAGGVIGGFWQVLVLFGLHWGLVPIIVLQLSDPGYSVITGPVLPAVLAQAAATFAVFLRTKDADTKVLAGPSALSGFLAGITEPAIYGVNLPRKLPFYFGIAGGVVGGILAGMAGSRADSFVFPSLISIPAYLSTPNLPLFFIGTGVAVVISFALTYLFGVKDTPAVTPPPAPELANAIEAEAEAAASGSSAAVAAGTEVLVGAPVAGRLVPLADVADPVFASGKMGNGVGIEPSSGTFVAPIAGKVVVAMKSGHAYGIRGDGGVEVLVHIGLDTVEMEGRGFTPQVAKGDRVEAGQVLCEVDLDAVRAAGHPTTTVLLVTNTAAQKEVVAATGDTVAENEAALIVTT